MIALRNLLILSEAPKARSRRTHRRNPATLSLDALVALAGRAGLAIRMNITKAA
jgi:hypothetical protein